MAYAEQSLFGPPTEEEHKKPKACVKCGLDTLGFRRAGPGHPTIPYCKVCFYTRRFSRCACKRAKGAKASKCHICVKIAAVNKKIAKLDTAKRKHVGRGAARSKLVERAALLGMSL